MVWFGKLLDSQKGGAVLKLVRRESGFSLIELMIGVAILAILLALAAPSYRAGLQNSQIRTAADGILTGLQLARAEAVRRNYTVQFALGTGTGWTVGCNPTTTDPDCPATIQQRSGTEGTPNAVVDVTQNPGAAATPVTIVFNGTGRVPTSSLPAGGVLTFDISNPNGGTCGDAMRCLRITVTTGGQIRMCEPALPSRDARAC